MTSTMTATGAVNEYLQRIQKLYSNVQKWMPDEEPAYEETLLELNEELTGPYKAKSLKVTRAGRPTLTFVPKGLCIVGARGRVDVLSHLGSEAIVWVEAGGPAIGFRECADGGIEMVSGRRMFPGVPKGWAWVDSFKRRLLHLDRDVFRREIVARLSE